MILHTIVSHNDVFKEEMRFTPKKSVKAKLETDLKKYTAKNVILRSNSNIMKERKATFS